MKVSTITATYNSQNEILATYESIKQQTYNNWEWLVTDDCSTDKTVLFLDELANSDDRINFFKQSVNQGAAVSRNNSLSHVTGEFIAFIDSDDIWLPDKLEKQIAFMDKANLDFSFTAYELINEKNERLSQQVDTHLNRFVTYEDILKKKATLGCSAVMLRRCAFSDISMPLT